MQGVHILDHGFGFENAVMKNVALRRGMREGEVLRVAGAEELQSHFH